MLPAYRKCLRTFSVVVLSFKLPNFRSKVLYLNTCLGIRKDQMIDQATLLCLDLSFPGRILLLKCSRSGKSRGSIGSFLQKNRSFERNFLPSPVKAMDSYSAFFLLLIIVLAIIHMEMVVSNINKQPIYSVISD